ncbi:selenoprotein K isoform X2 [Eublepharis macularius]|nr:selenoprotein K isoform X2 [Eublepharis macularius]
MVYISNGRVLDSRSSWSVSSITELFWGVVDFVILYIQSIINPHVVRRGTVSSSFSGYDDGKGPPGFPRRRMGQIRHLGGGPAPPPMGGGG